MSDLVAIRSSRQLISLKAGRVTPQIIDLLKNRNMWGEARTLDNAGLLMGLGWKIRGAWSKVPQNLYDPETDRVDENIQRHFHAYLHIYSLVSPSVAAWIYLVRNQQSKIVRYNGRFDAEEFSPRSQLIM